MKTRTCEVCNQVFTSKAHNAVNCSENLKKGNKLIQEVING
jgi:hypothetical protein